jgi:hypothetical protein
MDEFLRRLRAVNRTIDSGLSAKVFGKSSLQALVALLRTPGCTPLDIYRAIAALEPASAEKYRDGLSYLLRGFPGLNGTGVQLDDLKKQPIVQTRAALYRRTPLPPNYQPADPGVRTPAVFVQPPSAFMEGSIIEQLLASPADASILLIHLANEHDAGLEETFNGRTCLQYITSVVRVGRMVGCPVGVLSIGNAAHPPLCPVLMAEYRLVPQIRRALIHDDTKHTAGHRPEMQRFLAQRPRCVVMGFDGRICVFANVFGSWEREGDGTTPYRPPLITFADLIMSRATLATRQQLYANSPSFGKAEYGPLCMLGPN